jgi:hypothetical protein
MARDHVIERALQHREIHRTGDAERGDQQEPPAERPAVVALVQGEKPFLRERQRVALLLLVRHERGFCHRCYSFALLPVCHRYPGVGGTNNRADYRPRHQGRKAERSLHLPGCLGLNSRYAQSVS